ncbi:hypothetical protein [Oscillibacter sp.]|uniref:hypothetical protein n=1 Tax=Oscillibacter sp. TaxID=1945593 RepID=UPI00261FA179|nr:hypothetical protein [Oscillibacter sp.]MDD3347131.1 hypothetical protein [Oscillibacter sp.]
MENALFACPACWEALLPAGVVPLRFASEMAKKPWELLALTPEGCRRLGNGTIRCRALLVPGECRGELLEHVEAQSVVTYGLSPRDSLTFSSLTEPVLCVQRALPRPDGGVVEPQEYPLPPLLKPAELLPLLGLWLLQMPLTEHPFPW